MDELARRIEKVNTEKELQQCLAHRKGLIKVSYLYHDYHSTSKVIIQSQWTRHASGDHNLYDGFTFSVTLISF